jgi:palmitoyltransferase ZDHHC13/17
MISRTLPTEDSQSSAAVRISSTPLPSTGKAAAAPPIVTQPDDGIELKNIGSSGDVSKASLPVEDDIMQLARLGEVAAVQKLFETKRFSPTYRDEEGITPLHVCSPFCPF